MRRQLSSLLPSWSRSKWWFAFSSHALQWLYSAYTHADILTGIRNNFLSHRYHVMTSLCGPYVGEELSCGKR